MSDVYSCLVCRLTVETRGFKCNWCGRWTHRKCSPMLKERINEREYRRIAKWLYDFYYKCKNCAAGGQDELMLDSPKCTKCEMAVEHETERKRFLCDCKKWTHVDCHPGLEKYKQMEERKQLKNLECYMCLKKASMQLSEN